MKTKLTLLINLFFAVTAFATPGVTVDLSIDAGVTCNGGNTGSITATVTSGTANFDYVWSNGSSTLGTSSTTNTISSLPAGTYTLTVTDGNANTDTKQITIIASEATNTWTGTTNTDWNTATNWSTGSVPLACNNVTIANVANDPIIDEAAGTPAVCNDITIESGAILTINAAKALTVSGDITNNGDFVLESGATILVDGTISGSGTSTVKQDLDGGNRNYYLGSPVSGATAVVFDNGNEFKFSHNATEQRYYTLADGATLNAAQGYVYRSADAQTVEFTGTLNTGALINNSLPRTGTENAYRGYNLVANPYPSVIDWTLLTKTNLESTMVYRAYNGTNNVFDTYNATGGIGTNNNGGGAVDQYIAPLQGFWVRVDADGNTGSLGFDNTMRSHRAGVAIEQEHNILRFVITDGTNKDEAIINFDDNADTLVEAYDSRKMYSNIDAQIATVVDGEELVINSLPESEATSVPVKVNINKDGLYTLEATEQLGNLQGTNIYLEDLYTNQTVNFNAGDKYVFDAKTTDSDRFVVHFNVLSVSTNDVAVNESILIFGANKDVVVQGKALQNAQLSVFNLGGKLLKSTTLNGTHNIIPLDLSTGVYLVEVNNQGTVSRAKVILK